MNNRMCYSMESLLMSTQVSRRIIYQKHNSSLCVRCICFLLCSYPLESPLEVLAVGIQQFVGTWSSSEDKPLCVLSPQLGGEVGGILCLWYCRGRNQWACMCTRSEHVCGNCTSQPSPNTDAHATSSIQWKATLLLAKPHWKLLSY